VTVVVVLGVLHVEVPNPAKLTIDITVFGNFRVLGNTGSLDFILVVGIHVFLLGELSDSSAFCQLEIFVEVDLVVDMVLVIEGRG